jgi:hypothetical protein
LAEAALTASYPPRRGLRFAQAPSVISNEIPTKI